MSAQMPEELKAGHFGSGVLQFILYQHHFNRVPQNKIHEQLQEIGIDISVGQIDNMLASAPAEFEEENAGILDAGLRSSCYLQSDDTGARHAGKNGYCTVVGSDLFAYYASTPSKSRINFLKILQGRNADFVINEATIDYCVLHEFKAALLNFVQKNNGKIFHMPTRMGKIFKAVWNDCRPTKDSYRRCPNRFTFLPWPS